MNINTIRTLTLIAGILFLIQFVSAIVFAATAWLIFPSLLAAFTPSLDPATLAMITTIFTWLVTFVPIISILASIPTLIVAILTLRWRHAPEIHKMGLIIIGILGLLWLGTLPGLLALIAGALVEEPIKSS